MTDYPVRFELERPARMTRAHLFLRILLLVLASWIVGAGGGLGLVYLGAPALAAILIAQKNGERYLAEDGARVTGWLVFIVGVLAYVALLSDELPGARGSPSDSRSSAPVRRPSERRYSGSSGQSRACSCSPCSASLAHSSD